MIAASQSAPPVVGAGSWRTRITLVLCFAAALTEGYDITSMGVAAPHLGPLLHLTRAQLGPVFSASIVGLFVGALVVGRLADCVGRKWTLVGSLAVFGVFSAATVLASGFSDLVAIRVAAGLGLGGAMPNMIAMASEVSSARRRTMVTTIVAAGMPFGGMLSSAVAAGLDWRWIFYLGGAGPLLLAATMAPGLDESPEFVRTRRKEPHGIKVRVGFIWALTREGRTLTTVFLWVASFCGLMCLYTLLNWLPTLLGDKGVSKHDASVAAVLFNLGGGLGVIALAVLVEQARRRLVVFLWYASLILSLILLAAVGPQLAAVGTISFIAGGFSASLSILLYGLAPNYYPTTIRATGVGSAVAVGRLGAVVGPLFASSMLNAGVGQAGVLLSLAPTAIVAGAACLALLGRPTAV